jgi:type IV secretory pathway VirB6-like protein
MIGEIDVFGVFLPPLLVWLGIGLLLSTLLRATLYRLCLYRYVWHRPLFDLALLVILTGAVSYAVPRLF